MRTPLVVVTGVDPDAIDGTMVGLSWDLPRAVAVRHRIAPVSQVLTRTVSDAGGILEREEIALEHACVTCALREDIVPTLERLARDDRWSSIVAGVPTATEATQLAHVLATDTRLARHLRLSSVVAAMEAQHLARDLLSDDLLHERGWHTNPDDDRGVGETGCAQIEFADVVVIADAADATSTDLVRALAPPDAHIVTGAAELDGNALVSRGRQHARATAWHSPLLEADVPDLDDTSAWRLHLRSARPFHPERLLEQIERLGAGPHRSRGCFWLPTRPGAALEWSGAGGQLSLGTHSPWGRRTPGTRLIVTGVGTPTADLLDAFEELLLTPSEGLLDRRDWAVREDGFEPWLGAIRDAA